MEFGFWNLVFSQAVQKPYKILVGAVDAQLFAEPCPRHIDAVDALVGDGGNVFGRHIQFQEGAKFLFVWAQIRETDINL